MNATITINARTLVVGLLVVVALVVAYLLGGSGGTTPAAAETEAPAADASQPRELTMTGRGEASAVPDQLSFALAVNLKRPELADALDDANRAMSKVLGTLAEHGVAKDDVQTTGLEMNPVYQYHSSSPPTLTGYRVSERARVLVTDLKKAGAAVSAAVEAGGNDVRVNDLRLLVGDTEELMAQARAAAIEEARAKAEQYAAASGQELGEVLTISEAKATPRPSPVWETASRVAYDAALASVPIRAGRDEAAVTVKVVWELA